MQLNILFSDEDHCIVLKPAGMATHGRGSNTLLDALRREVAKCDDHLWQPVHRLILAPGDQSVLPKRRMPCVNFRLTGTLAERPTTPGCKA